MGYSKSSAGFNIVWGFLLIGFAIYFTLCSFILYVDSESWQHFIWGVMLTLNFIFGVANIIDGVKILIKIEEKNKSNEEQEDYDVYE